MKCSYCLNKINHPKYKKSRAYELINPWFVKSKKYDYCFWNYLNQESDASGNMKPKSMQEVGRLLGYSTTTIYFTLKKALDKIKNSSEANLINFIDQRDGSQDTLEEELYKKIDSLILENKD